MVYTCCSRDESPLRDETSSFVNAGQDSTVQYDLFILRTLTHYTHPREKRRSDMR
ncbi:hypothetical protein AN958_05836 [Leucoagaricus sp. SymC.cos]|nr:hypothetical protein AN958_05836 [Leucoagaricus sp. SymC.cos]